MLCTICTSLVDLGASCPFDHVFMNCSLLGAPPDSVADEKDEEEIDVKRTAWCQCLVVGERLHQRADEVRCCSLQFIF